MFFWWLFFSNAILFSVAQYPANPIKPLDESIDLNQPNYPVINSNVNENVDHIENVESLPNQIIVITTKVGPVETLKVSIILVDVVTRTQLPAFNMSGFLLAFTRGRYTIGGLHPNTWYGLSFYSEQTTIGVVHQNSEYQLVRTAQENGLSEVEQGELYSIDVHTKDYSADTRFIAIKWLQEQNRRKSFYVTVYLTLMCNDNMRFKQFNLTEQQLEHDIPVKLDIDVNIVPINHRNNEVFASATPKSCHGICWTTILGATVHNQSYEKLSAKKCEPIEAINVTTTVRKFLGYDTIDDKVLIHTNFSTNNPMVTENDSYVEMTIINLLDMTERKHNYSITANDFILEHLNPTSWYMAEYKYHRNVPFSLWEIERFTIEPNKTERNEGPVNLLFGYQILNNRTNGTEFDRKPHAKLSMNFNFTALTSVGIDTEPFCGSPDQHFWLTKENPERELNASDLISAICTESPNYSHCNNTSRKKCPTSKYCYRASLVLTHQVYSMQWHCVDIASQFANAQPKHANENRTNVVEKSSVEYQEYNFSPTHFFSYNFCIVFLLCEMLKRTIKEQF